VIKENYLQFRKAQENGTTSGRRTIQIAHVRPSPSTTIASLEGFCGGFLPVALVVALLNLICLLIRVHFCSFLLIHDYF
jgi:hypothetical protein